jgi:proteasome accessory factor C
LDRITGAEVLEASATPPEGLGLHDLSQGLFQPDPEDPLAVIDLQPQARWVSEYYPCEAVEELGDGRLRVSLRFSDPGWLQRLVLRLGGSATLLEPVEEARVVDARARAALSHYTG